MEASLRGTGKAVIYTGHGSVAQANSFGMAVYVPAAQNYLSTYGTLALTHAAPRWAQFLQAQRQ